MVLQQQLLELVAQAKAVLSTAVIGDGGGVGVAGAV